MCLMQHDLNVAAMLSALDLYDKKSPGYASAFAVELYSDENKYIKLIVKQDC